MGYKRYVGFTFYQPMAIASRTQALRLTLLANDVLPEGLTWRIPEGYLRTATWNEEGESITLCLWGPGDLVTNAHSGSAPSSGVTQEVLGPFLEGE